MKALMHFPRPALFVLLALAATACGGGGADIPPGAGGDGGSPVPNPNPGNVGDPTDGGTNAPPLRRLEATTISAGGGRTCAIIPNGSVKCWGTGILGTSSSRDSSRPALVLDIGFTAGKGPNGADDPITGLGVAISQICLLAASGSLVCYGRNPNGEVGDGTREERRTPVAMQGASTNVAAVTAGNNHTCILTKAGGVRCTGHNIYGQLGNGTKDPSTTLVDVVGLSAGVRFVTAGVGTTCAILTATGELRCWGANTLGQLGNGGAPVSSAVPVPVTGLSSGVLHVALGWDRSCAVTAAGGVQCWGTSAGYDPNGSPTRSNVPVDVPGIAGAVKVAVADTTAGGLTCALTSSKKVYCWGIPTRVGTSTPDTYRVPTEVAAPGAEFVDIEMGQDHTCGVTTNMGTLCWGGNSFGEIGDGTKEERRLPTPVPDP